MRLRFIHTSDWQIGKVFRFVDDAVMGQLQNARLEAITRLGMLAVEHGAGCVLVAGDVYDKEELSPRSLNQPLERMRLFPTIEWHLLPGNHDPHRPNGLWERLSRRSLPGNVRLHLEQRPAPLPQEGWMLLPAPLFHKRGLNDPTSWMDGADLPAETGRIGLAHGSIKGFGSEEHMTPNRIDPDRPARAGLSWLALGDWHGQRIIHQRCGYSGTPETDGFDVEGGGQALLVDIEAPGAPPAITPLAIGHYRWLRERGQVADCQDIDHLAARLRALDADPSRIMLHLAVEGTLSLADRHYFEETLLETVSAGFCFMRIDDEHLFASPTDADLDRIDRGGFVRAAADELKRQAETGGDADRPIAAAALRRLYLEHMKLQAGQR